VFAYEIIYIVKKRWIA